MNEKLSLRQRIHNAAGSQAAEELHATHAYLHARLQGEEEWGKIWSHSDQTAWGHVFGRMRGFNSIWNGSVTYYNSIVYNFYNSICMKYPQVGGIDPRPLSEISMHILDTDIIEVAEDGMSARGSFYTPGCIFCNYDPHEQKRFSFVCESYGSDFVFEDGEWKYLHEQVYPEYNSLLDCDNWGLSTMNMALDREKRPKGNLASGGTRPPLEEPDLGMKIGNLPLQPLTDIVPWPEPYVTLDDDNTYAKHWPPKESTQSSNS